MSSSSRKGYWNRSSSRLWPAPRNLSSVCTARRCPRNDRLPTAYCGIDRDALRQLREATEHQKGEPLQDGVTALESLPAARFARPPRGLVAPRGAKLSRVCPRNSLANIRQPRIVLLPASDDGVSPPSAGRIEFGLWLSLVERLVRVEEVQGSNPCSPTNSLQGIFRARGKWRSPIPREIPL